MMPVTQLIAMMRRTPPQSAVGLLTAMPADRLPVVIAAMAPPDVARLLPATGPDLRDALIDALSASRLAEVMQAVPTDQAVAVLRALPPDRLRAVVDGLPDESVSVLLATLPKDRQAALVDGMDPHRVYAVLSRTYEHNVAQALRRSNADVTVPDDAPGGILLVQTLGRRVAVAARYGDDGRVAVRDAEDAAYWLRASAALSVTNHQPREDVVRYCHESQRAGRPIDAVAWIDTWQDSALNRTLVRLFQ
jgi:Mg/Co/Ni transporter MgtE